ncbi:MAG: CehA/McbA family metallohydrolase [Patescibacteria group bacterium]|jgi:hypothetical protein
MKKIFAYLSRIAPAVVAGSMMFQPFHADIPQKNKPAAPQYPNTPAKDFHSDAPWVFRGGLTSDIPIITFIKDANIDPLLLDYVAYYMSDTNELIARYDPNPDMTVNYGIWWLRLYGLDPAEQGLAVGDTLKLRVETRFRDQLVWHTYQYFLEIQIGPPLPSLAGWYRGDTHHHTYYSDNTFEFGGEPLFDAQAAESTGLDWMAVTDHSYDVTPAEWDEIKLRSSQSSTSTFRLLPGLEFSADNNNTNDNVDDRIHLLGFGLQNWISGPESIPSFDVHANAPRTLSAILGDIQAQIGVAYASHPEAEPIQALEWSILPKWTDQNYSDALASPIFAGLEIFNRRQTSANNNSVTTGNMNPFPWSFISNWDTEWLNGITKYNQLLGANLNRKIFIAGGADAHGDANYQTFNTSGSVNVSANNNAIGKVHTAVYLPGGLTDTNIIDALRNGRAIATDGPLGTLEVRRNSSTIAQIGDRIPYQGADQLAIQAVSSTEFGSLTEAILHVVNASGTTTVPLPLSGLSSSVSIPISQLNKPAPLAVWLETRTAEGYRSFSNPIWLDVVCGDANGDGLISIADPVNLINYIFAGGPAPVSGDPDHSGRIDIGDAVYLINYIFASGPAPVCS